MASNEPLKATTYEGPEEFASEPKLKPRTGTVSVSITVGIQLVSVSIWVTDSAQISSEFQAGAQ